MEQENPAFRAWLRRREPVFERECLVMRLALPGLLLAVATSLPVAPARAQTSCWEHRAICESVCTPDRVARYYFGARERCTASCGPRWLECMSTGLWVDLERQSSGGTEYAPPF